MPGEDIFQPLGEALMWMVALEDLVMAHCGSYVQQRDADVDGAMLPGIRYARNAMVHGELVVSTVSASGGAVLGAAVLGAFSLGEGPSVRWKARTSIGFTPRFASSPSVLQQEQSYDNEITGRNVLPLLSAALAFLHHAAGT
ncbi:MAG TPA: hypothetical protein VHY18_02970 [Solirubrobacteraceae bacterium]|jgi:hypothetical protein|nr:hypothetical protein [Solirubrobacteraceae bacterium]